MAAKVKNISGFPEWLPEERLVEESIIETIRSIFRSFGFTPIETPAVELKSTLSSKGVIDKEIYLLRRALKEDADTDDEELALHFDLTVPFARYTAQHFNELDFPFRRYQLQKVWRGERPQRGRFREFYQFDIDIIARDNLPIACDAEIIAVIEKVFRTLNVSPFNVRINNRKVLLGYYESLGLSSETQKAAITIVDKLDKIGKEKIAKELSALGLSEKVVSEIIRITDIRFPLTEIAQGFTKLSCDTKQFLVGKEEIEKLARNIPEVSRPNVLLDMSLARGLDYYTGTIYETLLTNHPEYGSVSSGGRYEDLAGQFINQKLPGVGGSIGITRLMDFILKNKLIQTHKKCPSKLLITVYDEAQRPKCNELAEYAREVGVSCEVFPSSPKLGKQIDYAASKGISFVVFVDAGSGAVRIKDIVSKEEAAVADFEKWCRNIATQP